MNTHEKNGILAEITTKLLEERRRTLTPLENIIKKFEGVNN
jgi:hypothetical protein